MQIFIAHEDHGLADVIGAYSTEHNAEAAVGRRHMSRLTGDAVLEVLTFELDDGANGETAKPVSLSTGKPVRSVGIEDPMTPLGRRLASDETVSRAAYDELVVLAERYRAAHNRKLVELEDMRTAVADLTRANLTIVERNENQSKALRAAWALVERWRNYPRDLPAGAHVAHEAVNGWSPLHASELASALSVNETPSPAPAPNGINPVAYRQLLAQHIAVSHLANALDAEAGGTYQHIARRIRDALGACWWPSSPVAGLPSTEAGS